MKFKEGDSVEVLRRNEKQYDSWFPGRVTLVLKEKYSVRYESFQTVEGKLIKETVNAKDLRPRQPQAYGKDQWNVGNIVEVFDLHSWRIGSIAKVLKDGYVVARLFGSIQLKQFHTSDVRARQAWKKNKWASIEQVTEEQQYENDYDHGCAEHAKGLDEIAYRGPEVRDQTFKGIPTGCISPVKTIRKNLIVHPGNLPHNALKGAKRKRKASPRTVGLHPQTGRPLTRKAGALKISQYAETGSFRLRSDKTEICPPLHADKNYTNKHAIYTSWPPARVTEEVNECSFASCSGNEFIRYTSLRQLPKGNASNIVDDAMSSCPSGSREDNKSAPRDEFANIHELELHAYRLTMQALHASGPLSWEQESLLTNLRLYLNISNEEHLLHLRHLLSLSVPTKILSSCRF